MINQSALPSAASKSNNPQNKTAAGKTPRSGSNNLSRRAAEHKLSITKVRKTSVPSCCTCPLTRTRRLFRRGPPASALCFGLIQAKVKLKNHSYDKKRTEVFFNRLKRPPASRRVSCNRPAPHSGNHKCNCEPLLLILPLS